MKVRGLFFVCLVSFVAITLTNCSTPKPKASPDILNNYRYGGAYMKQMNYSLNDERLQKQEAALRKDGVQLISVGQEYKLVIPGKILFYPDSPRIQWKSYAVLNDVVAYIQSFNKVNVQVTGLTRATGSPEFDRALSLNRARNVSNYLWNQEIGAGILYIRGYVVTEQSDTIEVSFRSMMM